MQNQTDRSLMPLGQRCSKPPKMPPKTTSQSKLPSCFSPPSGGQMTKRFKGERNVCGRGRRTAPSPHSVPLQSGRRILETAQQAWNIPLKDQRVRHDQDNVVGDVNVDRLCGRRVESRTYTYTARDPSTPSVHPFKDGLRGCSIHVIKALTAPNDVTSHHIRSRASETLVRSVHYRRLKSLLTGFWGPPERKINQI